MFSKRFSEEKFANDLSRFFRGRNLGAVLAGPGNASAFLVCRTLRLDWGRGVGVLVVPNGIVTADSGGVILLCSDSDHYNYSPCDHGYLGVSLLSKISLLALINCLLGPLSVCLLDTLARKRGIIISILRLGDIMCRLMSPSLRLRLTLSWMKSSPIVFPYLLLSLWKVSLKL